MPSYKLKLIIITEKPKKTMNKRLLFTGLLKKTKIANAIYKDIETHICFKSTDKSTSPLVLAFA